MRALLQVAEDNIVLPTWAASIILTFGFGIIAWMVRLLMRLESTQVVLADAVNNLRQQIAEDRAELKSLRATHDADRVTLATAMGRLEDRPHATPHHRPTGRD